MTRNTAIGPPSPRIPRPSTGLHESRGVLRPALRHRLDSPVPTDGTVGPMSALVGAGVKRPRPATITASSTTRALRPHDLGQGTN